MPSSRTQVTPTWHVTSASGLSKPGFGRFWMDHQVPSPISNFTLWTVQSIVQNNILHDHMHDLLEIVLHNRELANALTPIYVWLVKYRYCNLASSLSCKLPNWLSSNSHWNVLTDFEGRTDDKIKAQEVVEELRTKRADMQVLIWFFEKYVFSFLILILLFQHKLFKL